MLNFVVCFINEFKQNTKFLEDNFMEIMGIFFTLYIGLVAFVYPKIIDTKEKIKDISKILTNRIDEVWYIKGYLNFTIFIILIDLVFFYICINSICFIIINIIYSIFISCLSFLVFKDLEEFLFKPAIFLESIDNFNFENRKDFLKKIRNNIILYEDLMLNTIEYNNHLDYIKKLFIKFIETVKNNYNPEIHNEYFELIFNCMNYLNQEIIKENNKYKIHRDFMNEYYYMIQQYNTIFLTEITKKKLLLTYI